MLWFKPKIRLLSLHRMVFQDGDKETLELPVTEQPSASTENEQVPETPEEQAGKLADPEYQKLHPIAIKEGKKKGEEAFLEKRHQEKLPPLPDAIKDLKYNPNEAYPNPSQGTIEQPFKFGDSDLDGKIVMPEHPDANAKTSYIFNYVDDASKFDQSQFLKMLEEKKANLGNTIIITLNLKTPDGETPVNGEDIKNLLSEVEKFQSQLPADANFSAFRERRPEKILHMTDVKNSKKVLKMLEQFTEKAKDSDSRVAKYRNILNTDKPENFIEKLQNLLEHPTLAEAPESKTSTPENSTKPLPSLSSPKSPSHSFASSNSAPATSSVPSTPTETQVSKPESTPLTQPSTVAAQTENATPNINEAEPGKVDKLVYVGDSLSEATFHSINANQKINKILGGKGVFTSWTMKRNGKSIYNESMLSIAKNMDKSGEMESMKGGKFLILGGTNDLTKDPDKVIASLREIWQIAKKHGLTVYGCTIPPFAKGGHDSYNGNGVYEKANANRKKINQAIIAAAESGEIKLVPLHKKLSEGGVADEKDEDTLHPDLLARDGLHPSGGVKGKGSDLMAHQIQKIIGEKA